jgi:dolichol-phosphate mannosyltransferase
MDALLRVLRRFLSKEQRRFVKFCLVGGSGVPVNLFFMWLGYRVTFAGLALESHRRAAASLFGIFVSIFTNFVFNDLWTWKDRRQPEGRVLWRLLRFYLVCSFASLLQVGTVLALKRVHYLLAQLLGIAIATAVNFVINNAWTFRKHPPKAEVEVNADAGRDSASVEAKAVDAKLDS